MGGILEVQGVTEVTPYAWIEKLVAWRRRAAKNCRYPLFWVNKRQKKAQTTITREEAPCEGCGGLQGGTEVTPGALLLMFPRRRRRAALDSGNTPRGQKTTNTGSHNNQQVVEDAWERQEDARGCINTIKL